MLCIKGTVVVLVIEVCGILVEVHILELSRLTCPGVGICHTSIGLGQMMVQELD